MSSFDRLILALEAKFVPKKSNVPKWTGSKPAIAVPANIINRFDWRGVSASNWKGPPIVNTMFYANNAGPFVFTPEWDSDFQKLSANKQAIVDRKFNNLLNSPYRTAPVEIKHSVLGTTYVWQLEHDMYALFKIIGPEKIVKWFSVLDDHDVYIRYLKTGRKN